MARNGTEAKKVERQFLVFTLQGEKMGLPIGCVREVLKVQEIRPLVHAPDFIEGVIFVRHCVLVVVSLRKRFGLKAGEDNAKARIIICRVNNMILGLIVDGVSEVLKVPEASIQQTPEILTMQDKGRYVSGLVKEANGVVTLLDLERIVTRDELARLSGIKP